MNTEDVRSAYNKEDRTHYEEQRWTSSPVAKSGYILTKEAIEKRVLPHLSEIKEYLEIGPGPGTWTRILLPALSDARIHLVDISRTMLDSAKKNLPPDSRYEFTESDFLAFTPERKYDILFSSRALEYFPDKDPVVATISQSLRRGGRAYLITKMPHYTRMKMLGKDPSPFHSQQISPRALSEIFQRNEMIVLSVYPVYVVFPALHLSWLNLLLTRFLRIFPWNFLTASLAESYLITAEKS